MMIKKYILHTGPIKKKNSFKERNDDIFQNLYLGNWCFLDAYINKNESVVEYHWDDRKKLDRDYIYLEELFEKILISLVKSLNSYHQKKYSPSFWRVLIGYWLHCFLAAFFDRWENISKAFKDFANIEVVNVFFSEIQPVADNTREFMNLISDEKWNQNLYLQILLFLKEKKFKNINILKDKYSDNNFYRNYKINFKSKVIHSLIKVYLKSFSFLVKKNKYIFFKTYLSLYEELKINLRLKQLPNFFPQLNTNNKIDTELRKKMIINFQINNLFEKFISQQLFLYLPKEFLEDFEDIGIFVKKNFPLEPKIIFTTRALSNDNIFIRFVADSIETNNAKLILCQHGGVYGHFKFMWSEEHEAKISNFFLTWGWKNNNYKNMIPFGYIKNIGLKNLNKKPKKKINKISYFLRSRAKYTHRLDSSIGSNQMSKYYLNCFNFFKEFPDDILKKKIIPRFHTAEFGWNHLQIWSKHFPELNFKKSSDETMKEVVKKYDLIIFSYIATGFLETLMIDKPFLLISSLEECPLREEVYADFMELKKVKIFFETNLEAQIHLKNIENNLDLWWNNNEVVKVKEKFKNKFVKPLTSGQKIDKIIEFITQQ